MCLVLLQHHQQKAYRESEDFGMKAKKRSVPSVSISRMSKRKRTKFVHEGNYVAEVDVELLEEPEGWSPYLSLEDAYRLDDVREALRRGDVKTAAKYARVFSLTPVAV